jgi:signal transduction histidine kinase
MYRRYGLPVSVDTVQVLQKIAEPASIILFAVVRELLLNVVKHARATEANVRVCDENGILVISISDNGAGFAADPKNLQRLRGERFGLFSISERVGYLGGEFTIRSSPGAGTAAVIRIPAAKLSESCESNETCESKEEKSNGG